MNSRSSFLATCGFTLGLLLFVSTTLSAQQASSDRPKLRVYGEVSYGAGVHLFTGRTQRDFDARVDTGFAGNRFGNSFAFAFFAVPERTPNFGFGFGAKGTFGAPDERKADKAQFFFNGYSISAMAKWFPFEKQFNKGWLLRGQLGFGQFLQKMRLPAKNVYDHQYGIGNSALIGTGYAFPIGKRDRAIIVEAQLEYNSRQGDQTRVGEKLNFTYGQASLNVGYSF
jgi:hypothetical protein